MADVRKMYEAGRRRWPREVAFLTSPAMRRDVLNVLACYFCPAIIPEGHLRCPKCDGETYPTPAPERPKPLRRRASADAP